MERARGPWKIGTRERQPVFLEAGGGDFCPGKDILPQNLGFTWESLITIRHLITDLGERPLLKGHSS